MLDLTERATLMMIPLGKKSHSGLLKISVDHEEAAGSSGGHWVASQPYWTVLMWKRVEGTF